MGGGYDNWRRDNEEGNAGYKSLSNLYNEFVPGCFSECTGTTYSAYQGGLGESVGHTRFGAGLGITSFGGVMMRRAMPDTYNTLVHKTSHPGTLAKTPWYTRVVKAGRDQAIRYLVEPPNDVPPKPEHPSPFSREASLLFQCFVCNGHILYWSLNVRFGRFVKRNRGRICRTGRRPLTRAPRTPPNPKTQAPNRVCPTPTPTTPWCTLQVILVHSLKHSGTNEL